MRSAFGTGIVLLMLCQVLAAEEGGKFVPLYNGKDLSGWAVFNGKLDAWKADGDVLNCLGSGGGWLRTKEKYSDFTLKLEYRIPKGGNTGVAFRFPREGNPAHNGMEVQILDDEDPKYAGLKPAQYTGGIYYQLAAEQGHQKKIGEWNSLEITCRGPQVKVVLNGATILDANVDKQEKAEGPNPALSERPKMGYIGLQGNETAADFRKIELMDLTQKIGADGLKYVDIVEGKGDEMPAGGRGTFHYSGWLLDGHEFDSSYQRGEPYPGKLSGVSLIRGWREGIPGMKVGGIRKLIIPAKMAYGVQKLSGIPPNSDLIFYVELVSVDKESN